MKLVDKFTLWFMGVFILVTPVSMYISLSNNKKNIDTAEINHTQNIHQRLANRMEQGAVPARIAEIEVIKLAGALPAQQTQVQELSGYNEAIGQSERFFRVSTFHTIKGSTYKITSLNHVPKANQILSGMLKTLVWKLALMMLCVFITARLISRYILSSFEHTLQSIRNFNLRSGRNIDLKKTNVKEFKELNRFLESMTEKAIEEFTAVKEFSENASHELQTPLAVIRSKLELLAETDIHPGQAKLIGDMQNSVEKLSKINSSLVLLTRLENHEYQTTDQVDISQVARDVLEAYSDRVQLKVLQLEIDIDGPVLLHIHPALADMIMNNLLGNAIRHNTRNGSILFTLSDHQLMIKNTGRPPESPPEELFQRFKKGNQTTDSVGLGLAIVKQICDLNGYAVRYEYADDWHIVSIDFNKTDQKSTVRQKELQFT